MFDDQRTARVVPALRNDDGAVLHAANGGGGAVLLMGGGSAAIVDLARVDKMCGFSLSPGFLVYNHRRKKRSTSARIAAVSKWPIS